MRLALYNGTTVSGLTKKIEEDLQKRLPDVTVVAKENARKSTYATTLVIDLTGAKASEAQRVAALLEGTVQKMPDDEKKPVGADMLVIIGQDKASTTPTPSPTATSSQ